MSKEVGLLIIGAIISIIATMIGMFAQLIVQSILKNKGRVKIYIKKVYSKADSSTWGFVSSYSGTIFSVPMWIEFHNTKEKKEIIRNLNLKLFKNNKMLTNMVQASHFEVDEKKEIYANKGAYSFILNPTSISRYELQFMIKKEEVMSDFDEVRLTYYDSKDKYHEIHILDIESPWEIGNQSIDKDWITLNEKSKMV